MAQNYSHLLWEVTLCRERRKPYTTLPVFGADGTEAVPPEPLQIATEQHNWLFSSPYGSNAKMTDGSSSIFISAKSAEPASLSEAPMCHTVLSMMRKRSCDFW